VSKSFRVSPMSICGNGQMDRQAVIGATRRWVSSVVIGLNLCPFARGVFTTDKIRYVVSDAKDDGRLLKDFADEIKTLVSTTVSAFETTLLIHPCVLGAFLDCNDFLAAGERLIEELGQRGRVQLASFHPGYQFVGVEPGAVEIIRTDPPTRCSTCCARRASRRSRAIQASCSKSPGVMSKH
jgi:hypothetical protein